LGDKERGIDTMKRFKVSFSKPGKVEDEGRGILGSEVGVT
jgi:hypothetical protein